MLSKILIRKLYFAEGTTTATAAVRESMKGLDAENLRWFSLTQDAAMAVG